MTLTPKRLFQKQPGRILNLLSDQAISLENAVEDFIGGALSNFDPDPAVSLLANPDMEAATIEWDSSYMFGYRPNNETSLFDLTLNISRTTAYANGGVAGLEVYVSNGGTLSGWNRRALRGPSIPCTPLSRMQFKFDYRAYSNSYPSYFYPGFAWYNAQGGLIGWSELGSIYMSSDTWQTFTGAAWVPKGAVTCRPYMNYRITSAPVGTNYGGRFDNFIVSQDGASGWVTAGGSTLVARSTAQARSGAASLKFESASAGNPQIYLPLDTSTTADTAKDDVVNLPAVASDFGNFTYTVYMRGSVARTADLGLYFYGEDGALIESKWSDTPTAIATGAWTEVSERFRAPEGARYIRPYIRVNGATAANEIYYVDDISIVEDLGWEEANANTTLARSSIEAYVGTTAMTLTSDAAGAVSARTAPGIPGIPVVGGQAYLAGIHTLAATVSRSVSLSIEWYDQDGVFLSASAGDPVASTVGDVLAQWGSVVAYGIAPAEAVTAALLVTVAGAAGAGEVHYFDAASQNEVMHRVPDDGSVLYEIMKQLIATPTGAVEELLTLSLVPSGQAEGPGTRIMDGVAIRPGGIIVLDASQVLAPGDCVVAASDSESLTITCSGVEVS